jgi:hypothetical protein
MTIDLESPFMKLARLKWFEEQNLDPDEPVPEGRLTWEECVAMADLKHPLHDSCFKSMLDEAMDRVSLECN